MTLMAEVGTDISKFHSSKAFSNWLHLCPNEKITGGKVISSRTKRGSPLSKAQKCAVNAIGNLKTAGHLTNFFKRIAYKNGRKEAITAMAHKLAVIIYKMFTNRVPHKPFVRELNEKNDRIKKLKEIDKFVKKYNIEVEELDFCKSNSYEQLYRILERHIDQLFLFPL